MKKLLLVLIIALAGACAPLADASATPILFAGGEDMDFTLVGTTGVGTAGSGSNYATGYAREAIEISSETNAVPPASRVTTPAFTANSAIWVHAREYLSNLDGTNYSMVNVLSPDGVTRILVRTTGTAGTWKISTGNAAGTITDLVSMSSECFTAGVGNILDLYINYGTSGQVTLYCNGVSVANYTGNVATNSATQLNQVVLGGNNSSDATSWSEVIVSTTSTLGLRLVTLAPAANGNTDNWDVGGVSNVDETTLNTSNYNASGTAGEIQLYTVTPTSLPSGSWTVVDLWENIYAQVETSGPQHIEAMVRTGSTNYTSSNLAPAQGSWTWVSNDWQTNPYTGVPWTASDLGAAGFDMGFESAN
jgi:hypothetical protein